VRRIVVLDVASLWEGIEISAHEVVVVRPEAGAMERLDALDPVRVVVNLAAPGALETLLALREAGSTAVFRGCLVAPESQRALPLGAIEPVGRPLDPDAAVAAITGYAARGARIVTVGADVEALISLRQALTRQGMSVSRAWDAKQATDLLTMVRPDVVLIDLELRRQAYEVVAALTALQALPATILVPGSDDASQGFAAVALDPLHASRTITLDRVLADAVRDGKRTPASA
jgi:hypothetical protein